MNYYLSSAGSGPPTKRSRSGNQRTLDAFFGVGKKEPSNNPTTKAIDVDCCSQHSGDKGHHQDTQEMIKPKIPLHKKAAIPEGGPLAQRARPICSKDLVYETVGAVDSLTQSCGVGTVMRIIKYYEEMPKLMSNQQLHGGRQQHPSVPSMILWGPPGCGKTTLAQLLCRSLTSSGLPWRHTKLSAVNAGVNDVKKTVDEATNARRLTGTHTLLFLDEIHRFNKAQQDALLPHVENGTLTLIGATTENPSFQCNRALVSRCQIIKLSSLDSTSIENILTRAMSNYYPQVAVDKEDEGLMKTLADFGLGDARASLNALELACDLAIMGVQHFGATAPVLRRQHVEEAMSTSASGRHRLLGYDKNGDIHYDLASALQKSIRGSDKDAAAYWTTRMLSGGEPPEYISRRLMRIASEDVGLADPQALQITAAAHTVTMATGMPECSTALLEAALYLCNAPKSNAVYIAYKNAKTAIENATEDVEVPIHLRNAPTGFMKSLGYGRDYVYTNQPRPTAPGEMAPHQTYLPSGLQRGDIFPAEFHTSPPRPSNSVCPTCGAISSKR